MVALSAAEKRALERASTHHGSSSEHDRGEAASDGGRGSVVPDQQDAQRLVDRIKSSDSTRGQRASAIQHLETLVVLNREHAPQDSEADEEQPRHQRLDELGKGAMGEVYLGYDQVLKRTVAIKQLSRELLTDEEASRRFQNEALITAQLDHPGIVAVYDYGQDAQGRLEYSMKVVRGQTFADLIAEARAPFEASDPPDRDPRLAERLELFLQVCNAMHYAHQRGVLHRDLKPQNIMVGGFREVLVMDWGVARLIGTAEEGSIVTEAPTDLSATAAGSIIGSLGYMSPEQVYGKHSELDQASDQYSLGNVLFELVTLRPAVVADTSTDAIVSITAGERRPFEHVHGAVSLPAELEAVYLKATSKNAADRYPSVDAFAQDIRRYLRDEQVLALPDTRWRAMTRWVSHHREATVAAVLGLLLVMVLMAAAGIAVTLWTREQARRASLAREERMADLIASTSERAHAIDKQFLHVEAMLESFAAEARNALTGPAPPLLGEVYPHDAFDSPATAPADLAPVPGYIAPISFEHQVFKPPPGVVPPPEQLARLSGLQPSMLRTLVRSIREDLVTSPTATQLATLRQGGSPIVWLFASSAAGVHAKLPGKGGYPDNYDARNRPWYVKALQGYGPMWAGAYVDSDGSQLLVPCSMALRDHDGVLLGVAGLDMSVNRMVEELLAPDARADVVAYLVDGDGKVLVASSDHGKKDVERARDSLPYLGTLRDQRQDDHRHFLWRDQLVFWAPVDATGWFYVVEGPAETLMRAAGR